MSRSIIKLFSAIVLLLSAQLLIAQQVGKPTNGIFLLKNGTIHTITNGTYIGDVQLQDGKIAEIGKVNALPNMKVVDCTNKHIYPGFIDSGSRLGLVEIDAVTVTNDFRELGDFIPHMRALTAVNPNSVSIPITRLNGVTTVFAKPEGSTFPGTGALVDLFGYNPEQMSCGSERVLMRFPSTGRKGRFDRRTEDEIKKDAEKTMKNLNDIWSSALAYSKIDSTSKADKQHWVKNNPQMDALLPIVRKEMPLFVEVNSKSDIESALTWIEEKKIKTVLMGVAEGWRVADKIAKSGISVITGPILNTPRRENDRYDAAYTNAAKMSKAGVKVAIRTDNAENTRNLPFNAGFAAAYGMGIEEALKAITIYPAQIFGVADKYGSLEKGKVANILITNGDPFETKTKIEKIFIRGWDLPYESRQTLLYDEFLHRTP